jgi:hypothetical protein
VTRDAAGVTGAAWRGAEGVYRCGVAPDRGATPDGAERGMQGIARGGEALGQNIGISGDRYPTDAPAERARSIARHLPTVAPLLDASNEGGEPFWPDS